MKRRGSSSSSSSSSRSGSASKRFKIFSLGNESHSIPAASLLGECLFRRTLQTYISKLRQGVEGFAWPGRPSGWESTKTEMARCFLTHYASLHDRMPNSFVDGMPEVRPGDSGSIVSLAETKEPTSSY